MATSIAGPKNRISKNVMEICGDGNSIIINFLEIENKCCIIIFQNKNIFSFIGFSEKI